MTVVTEARCDPLDELAKRICKRVGAYVRGTCIYVEVGMIEKIVELRAEFGVVGGNPLARKNALSVEGMAKSLSLSGWNSVA